MMNINLWCSISDLDVVILIININLWCSISVWKGIKAKIQFAIWRFLFNITFSFMNNFKY